ncbi:hypothetical protein COCNU_11G012690 [Cocos nucifera]|uniref:Uncharacterized protein n=1 Tax=Cocos nucifera TaxID=13894 RepID=A0A8K0IPY4_COCNU|nr:hypothetical protein COCNU_11G012690 [Cocos nucifera]
MPLVHYLDHFAEAIWKARHISKEVEEKANQANRRTDDAELSKLKAEEKLKKEVERLEFELSKYRSDVEVWLDAEKKKYEEKLEAAKAAIVEAFKSSIEFRDIKIEFSSVSYLQGVEDLKEKLKNFPNFNLGLLDSDGEEEVGKVDDKEIHMEDLFSSAHEDQMVEDGASAPPPNVIILFDHVEVGESRFPDRA